MNNRCNFGKFFAGTLIGGIIGAVLALLYAPHSGEETRKIIKQKSKEAKTKALELKEEAKTKLNQAKKEAQVKAEDFKKRAKKAAEELKKEEEKV